MKTSDTRHYWLVTAALGAVAALAGCKKELVVTYYPEFYDEQLKTVAVMPFAGSSYAGGGGVFVTDRVIDALAATRTYTVVSGPDFLKRLDQAGFKLPERKPSAAGSGLLDRFVDPKDKMRDVSGVQHYGDPKPAEPAAPTTADLLAALRKLGDVDGVLTGRVTQFATGSIVLRNVTYYDDWPSYRHRPYYYDRGYYPRYYYYRRGYPASYDVSYSYQSQGTVAASVDLWRVADGKKLETAAEQLTVTSDGRLTRDACLTAASEGVAARLVESLTPSPMKLRIEPGKTVRTARRVAAGAMKYTGKFNADDEVVLIVVRLPAECDRNTFGVSITRKKDDAAAVFATDFVWSRGRAQRIIEVPMKALAADGGEKFRVNFLHGGRVLFDRKFEIRD